MKKKANLLEQRRGQDRVIQRLALQEERCCPYPELHTLLRNDYPTRQNAAYFAPTPIGRVPRSGSHLWVEDYHIIARPYLPFSAPAPRRPLNLQTAVSRLQSEVAAFEEQIEENRQCRQQLQALGGEKHHPTLWQLFRE
ncbi:Hypp6669 [Branchiostoma lanceolatum]|uniref:Hypp6669 protein n=1 Tax=Branchiostoma lanceolatum TaxID=7740 RepID=A0A8J9YVC5_BRALA|nr:Hypp6669 [Branchiostoma lanceolatum]